MDHVEIPLANISTRGQVLTGSYVNTAYQEVAFVNPVAGEYEIVVREQLPREARELVTLHELAHIVLQPGSAAVVVPAAFLGLVAGLGMTLQALEEDGDARPWYRREGFPL